MSVLRYSVVRYVPNPSREEYVNIGVVVASEDAGFAACKFTKDWGRSRRFGKEDVSFLRDFAAELTKMLPEQKELFARAFGAHDLSALATNWKNSIQFSAPRASIEADPRTLVCRLFEQFVADRPQRQFAPKKAQLLSDAKRQLKGLIRSRFDGGAPSVLGRETLRGKVGQHRFDVVVKNGMPLMCLDAISVQEEEADFDEHVRATGWDLNDVRQSHKRLELAVMLIDASRKQLDQTTRLFRSLHASVFPEKELGNWARKQVSRLPLSSRNRALLP